MQIQRFAPYRGLLAGLLGLVAFVALAISMTAGGQGTPSSASLIASTSISTSGTIQDAGHFDGDEGGFRRGGDGGHGFRGHEDGAGGGFGGGDFDGDGGR